MTEEEKVTAEQRTLDLAQKLIDQRWWRVARNVILWFSLCSLVSWSFGADVQSALRFGVAAAFLMGVLSFVLLLTWGFVVRGLVLLQRAIRKSETSSKET